MVESIETVLELCGAQSDAHLAEVAAKLTHEEAIEAEQLLHKMLTAVVTSGIRSG